MRSHRMRGYGAWCSGWNEAKAPRGRPNNTGPGPIFFLFAGLLVLLCFRTAIESGNGFTALLGIAIFCGVMKAVS